MSIDPRARFQRTLHGQTCRVGRGAHDWTFSFGDAATVVAIVPWRIIIDGTIAHADEDDAQWFGLPRPVDGEARANTLLDGLLVRDVALDPVTADLRISFDGEARLDLFNNSSGYEGWRATLRDGVRAVTIIALGGGKLTEFSD